MGWIRRHGGVVLGALGIVGWAWIVWRSGRGWNPSGTPWNFENTAQLGDSFGVLSSIMAAIAAYFAFRTYQSARDDIARLEQRAAEPSYLNLLERRFDVLDRIRLSKMNIGGPKTTMMEWHGQAALDRITADLRREIKASETKRLGSIFESHTKGVYGLPNFYRFTYHIVAFADRQFSRSAPPALMTKDDPAYQNVRLLRAQMSDAELVLVALNCAFGAGHDKFKPLVERYALLHNMNRADIELFELVELFAPEAFGLELKDRIRTDAPVIAATEPEEHLDL